jgi:hypothetical protein
MGTQVPDCLVLKINDSKSNTTIFVLYDTKEHQYVIRGKRQKTEKYKNYCDYSFVCNCAEDLADFLEFVIYKKNLWTYILYNYDNLPYDSNDITYDFLSDVSPVYELSGYKQQKYNKNTLLSNLKMLRNVFNYHN